MQPIHTYAQGSRQKQDREDTPSYRTSEQTDNGEPSSSHQNESINGMTTDEWRNAYEQEGCVDLWVEEEFNSGSRLMVSAFAAVHIGACMSAALLLLQMTHMQHLRMQQCSWHSISLVFHTCAPIYALQVHEVLRNGQQC